MSELYRFNENTGEYERVEEPQPITREEFDRVHQMAEAALFAAREDGVNWRKRCKALEARLERLEEALRTLALAGCLAGEDERFRRQGLRCPSGPILTRWHGWPDSRCGKEEK